MHVPWKVRNAARLTRNSLAFAQHKAGAALRRSQGKKVVFCCNFHGTSGATIAIARIADLLASRYAVSFVAGPSSDYNAMLGTAVTLVSPRALQEEAFDLYVCDGHMDESFFSWLAAHERLCLLTIHGVLRRDNKLEKVHLATRSHLVSEIQFMHHEVDRSRYFVIPNYCERIVKKRRTRNVGIVGRLDDPKKNVAAALEVARRSSAAAIHLWGGVDSHSPDGRVNVHAWSRDKNRIYDSFDVLVSMSEEESMGLTVIEAMSCGIPCVLADIPGFRIYRGCPGVALVPLHDRDAAVEWVDRFLDARAELEPALVAHWQAHYSPDAVAAQWFREVEALTAHAA